MGRYVVLLVWEKGDNFDIVTDFLYNSENPEHPAYFETLDEIRDLYKNSPANWAEWLAIDLINMESEIV